MVMPLVIDGEEYLTTNEACSMLGISRMQLYRIVKQKRLHQHKRGVTRTPYYLRTDVERLGEIRQVDDNEE